MKKIIFLVFVIFSFLQADKEDRFSDPKFCVGCHKDQTDDWITTWHSKSHYESNSLYSSVVDYISRVTYQPKEIVLVDCAQCHNPRMTIKSVEDVSFMYSKALNIETQSSKDIDKQIDDPNLKSGISCYVCHNVDKVHQSTDLKMRGFSSVSWGAPEKIFGAFKGDGRSDGFHKSEQAEHFVDSNQLCMVCHYGGENKFGTKIYATGEEASTSKDTTKCVDCHMSAYKKEVIAPHIKKDGVTPKVRDIRSHLFAGARNSDIMSTTLNIKSNVERDSLVLTVENKTPHKAPTGYGDRSIKISVNFKNQENKIIETIDYYLESIFVDKKSRETVPYIATSIKSDTRLNPNEIRNIKFQKSADAKSAEVIVTYRLVREGMIKTLKLEDNKVFNKEYPVYKFSVNF